MSMCGLDVDFDNPVFCCLEVDLADAATEQKESPDSPPRKEVVFYELDLGLNHVVRKFSEDCNPGAYQVMPVPGGSDGPGGCLVMSENYISYHNMDHEEVKCAIPRRATQEDSQGLLIVSSVYHKLNDQFVYLVQSEFGDIYKLEIDFKLEDEDYSVSELTLKYFDTVPVASSMCILKSGYLFTASEQSDSYLFAFNSIDPSGIESSSNDEPGVVQIFATSSKLKNLSLIDIYNSYSPIIDFEVEDLCDEKSSQIYAVCGTATRSSLRILRHGLKVSELVRSKIPGKPTNVFSIPEKQDGQIKYIVISFEAKTVVLSVGETIQEVFDLAFLSESRTILAGLLGVGSLLQVHVKGIRVIKPDGRIHEWKAPGKKMIEHASANAKQVLISLSGGEILYFQLDEEGTLFEVERQDMLANVTCVALPKILKTESIAAWGAVGCDNQTVTILNFDDESEPLRKAVVQAHDAPPVSVKIEFFTGMGSNHDEIHPFLYVGLKNGVLSYSKFDMSTGELTHSRSKFLGYRPITLSSLLVEERPAVLCISDKSWLSYTHLGKHRMTPLSYTEPIAASFFASEQCPEGFCCVSKAENDEEDVEEEGKQEQKTKSIEYVLQISSFEQLGSLLHESRVYLNYTPRKILIHPFYKKLVIIEGDHNSASIKELDMERQTLQQISEAQDAKENEKKMEEENEEEEESDSDEEEVFEAKKRFVAPSIGKPGQWGSCIRIIDPRKESTVSTLEIGNNESAISACIVKFNGRPDYLLAVGVARNLKFSPLKHDGGSIHIYSFAKNGNVIERFHKTDIPEVPYSMTGYNGHLVVGCDSNLRMYALGQRQLIKKCENRSLKSNIRYLASMGDRIFLGESSQGASFAIYKPKQRQIHIFADTTTPKHLTELEVTDYDSVCCGDKFGNIWISRLLRSSEGSRNTLSAHQKYGKILMGAPSKLYEVAHFFTGEVVTSIKKRKFSNFSQEVLVYATANGSINALVPFTTREAEYFFLHLEMHMRQQLPPLGGRDHMSYRSSFSPVKAVYDGSLCFQYSDLPKDKQVAIAEEMESEPAEIEKALDEIFGFFY